MTYFDIAVVGIILLSLMFGVWRGVVSEILALVAWVVAFLVADEWAIFAGEWVASGVEEAWWRQVIGFICVFVAVLIVFTLARKLFAKMLNAIGLRPLDRVLGAIFGAARGVLVVFLAVLLAGMTALPQKSWWRNAKLAPMLETAVLASKPWLPQALSKRIKYR